MWKSAVLYWSLSICVMFERKTWTKTNGKVVIKINCIDVTIDCLNYKLVLHKHMYLQYVWNSVQVIHFEWLHVFSPFVWQRLSAVHLFVHAVVLQCKELVLTSHFNQRLWILWLGKMHHSLIPKSVLPLAHVAALALSLQLNMRWGAHTKHDFWKKQSKKKNKTPYLQAIETKPLCLSHHPACQGGKTHRLRFRLRFGEDKDNCTATRKILECSQTYGFKFLTLSPTFGEETFTWTIIGASEVLRSCAGWLMVSASSTTNCRERANSKIRSISLCTSAEKIKNRDQDKKRIWLCSRKQYKRKLKADLVLIW